jgi:hypothetical protein
VALRTYTRAVPAYLRERYPRMQSVRVTSASRSGHYNVWAEPLDSGPTMNHGGRISPLAIQTMIPEHRARFEFDLPSAPDSTD